MENIFDVGESSRDEFFNIISDKAVVSYHVASDLTGTILGTNNTTETTLLSVTIPKDSVINGIRIKALVSYLEGTDADSSTHFLVKVGPTGTETTRFTSAEFYSNSTTPVYITFWIEIVLTSDDVDFGVENTVLIRGKQANSGTSDTGGHILLVDGF